MSDLLFYILMALAVPAIVLGVIGLWHAHVEIGRGSARAKELELLAERLWGTGRDQP